MTTTRVLLMSICIFNLIHCTNKIRCHNNGTGGDESDEDDCREQTVDCESGDDCQIDCAGAGSCNSATLNCADNNNCIINCDHDEFNDIGSCRDALINCPNNGDCTINCGATRGGSQKCMGLMINATFSKSLTINGCYQYEQDGGPDSCSSITVHAGVDTKSNFAGNAALKDLNIYTAGDFSNVEFTYNGGNCEDYPLGSIYCGGNTTSCHIGFDDDKNAQCISGSGRCTKREADTEYIVCFDTDQDYETNCQRKNFNCSNKDTKCVLRCNGHDGCDYSTFTCNDNYKCITDCRRSLDISGLGQCESMDIYCPDNAECVVICGDESHSCSGINIRAENSTALRIENCFCYNSDEPDCCNDLNVKCPTNGICYIEGRGEVISEGKITVDKTINTTMVWNITNPGFNLEDVVYGDNCWFNCTDFDCSASGIGLVHMIVLVALSFYVTF